MKFFFLLFLLVFSNSLFHAQIVSVKQKNKKSKEVGSSTLANEEEKTLFYLSYSIGNSYRFLKSNGDFYGEELGEKTSEIPTFSSGFYFNINNKFDKNIFLDFGLGFHKYGEKYENNLSDTSIYYENSYSQVVIPLKVHFQKGKNLKFFFNSGIQAQLLSAYKNDYTLKVGDLENNTINNVLKNKNSFSLASTSSLGLIMRFSPKSCMLISGDFIQQLTNTFNKQGPFIHKSNFYGFKIGFGFKI